MVDIISESDENTTVGPSVPSTRKRKGSSTESSAQITEKGKLWIPPTDDTNMTVIFPMKTYKNNITVETPLQPKMNRKKYFRENL